MWHIVNKGGVPHLSKEMMRLYHHHGGSQCLDGFEEAFSLWEKGDQTVQFNWEMLPFQNEALPECSQSVSEVPAATQRLVDELFVESEAMTQIRNAEITPEPQDARTLWFFKILQATYSCDSKMQHRSALAYAESQAEKNQTETATLS